MSSPNQLPLTEEVPQSESSSTNSEFLVLDNQQLDDQDRTEILESIEKVAAQNRISASESLFKITPLKRGLLFPLLINLLAAVAVAVGFVGSNIYFSRKQADISSQAGTFFSAEGKLIAQVQQESAAKLKAKDQEITQVKGQLTKLNQESADLRNNMQATISAREVELKKQMQTQLQAEKARLQKLGISPVEINTRLKAFEDQKNAEFAVQLSQYRAQSEAALQQKEAQIKTQQDQIQQTLNQATKDRQQLLNQAQTQEAQLRSQYEAKNQQLQSANQQLQAQTSAAQQKLHSLSLQSQNEQLLSDQIVGSYNTILGDIQQANYTRANTDIASLQNLLNSPSVDAIPTLAQRRPVDLRLIQSLKELITARTRPNQPAIDPAVLQRSNQVVAAEKLVGQAETAQKSGNASSANDLYTKAIAQVPIIQRAYEALTAVFKRNQSDQIALREQTIAALRKESADKSTQIAQRDQTIATLRKQSADQSAQFAQGDQTIAALRKESADKSAQIAQLEKSLSDTQANLKTAQATVADLRKQVADQTAQISSPTTSAASASGAVSDLKKQVADQEKQLADLKSQLDQANASVSELKKQIASGSTSTADLQKQLADEKKATADAQAKLAEQTAAAQRYKNALDSGTTSSGALKQKLADNEQQITKLTSDLNAAQARINGLEKNATGVLDTFSSVQNDYAGIHDQLMSLIASGTPQDIRKAREILLQFINGSGVNTVLPGFSKMAADVTTVTEKVAKASGEQNGRETALKQVIGVMNYFSTPSPNAAAVKAQIDKAAQNDPLFSQTAANIQKLAQQADQSSASPGLAVANQLIGTISYIASNTITVEKLVNVKISDGATVVIRHKNGQGVEMPIAEGKVTKHATDSVEVTIESLLGGNVSPQLLDVVYLQPQSGT